MIVGGWDYVFSAYGVAWTAIALYGLHLWRLHRAPPASPTDLGRP